MRGVKAGWGASFVFSLGVLAACGLVGPAYAGDVDATVFGEDPELTFTVLTFTAEPGETNRLVIARTAGSYRVTDLGAPLTALGDCFSTGAHEATCPIRGVTRGTISVGLGDLDDSVAVGVRDPVFVAGGDGADTITVESLGACAFFQHGCEFTNELAGGAGDDTLVSGFGSYMLEGGEGEDVLDGRLGRNDMLGGPGADTFMTGAGSTVSYAERTSGVVVDADGNADDGEPGENDNVLPLAPGGFAQLFIVGGRGDDRLFGGGGVWGLVGMAGDDLLVGGPRSDELFGGAGHDTVWGEAGNDFLLGGRGDDLLVGGTGRDWVGGLRGDDTLRMRDGFRDRVVGGHGMDRARVDPRLDVVRFVEALF